MAKFDHFQSARITVCIIIQSAEILLVHQKYAMMWCTVRFLIFTFASHSVISFQILQQQKLSLLTPLLPFFVSGLQKLSLFYCSLYNNLSSNYYNRNRYHYFTLLKVTQKSSRNLFAIASKSKKMATIALKRAIKKRS